LDSEGEDESPEEKIDATRLAEMESGAYEEK